MNKASNEAIPLFNCLLYTNDVVLISDKQNMVHLLKICGQYCPETDYKWNPVKCVILNKHPQSIGYKLYNQVLPRQNSFAYIIMPFKPGDFLDPES